MYKVLIVVGNLNTLGKTPPFAELYVDKVCKRRL